MWDQTTNSDLVEGVARAQRLAVLMASEAGNDVRGVLLDVCRTWFAKVMKGEPNAHVGLLALNDFANSCDLVILLGEGMATELVARKGGDYARAAAD